MTISFTTHNPATHEDMSFDPGRDIAVYWPQLINMAAHGCLEENWQPFFGPLLANYNIDQDTLMSCMHAYCMFCANATEPELNGPHEALAATGFFNHHPVAQLAVLAKVAQLASGAFWAGIRHSVMTGVVPKPLQMIRQYADVMNRHLDKVYNHEVTWTPKVSSQESVETSKEDNTVSEGNRVGRPGEGAT